MTRELSKTDASHGWCAGLIIHHAHLIAQYPKRRQKAVWTESLDVPIAASFAPSVTAVAGGRWLPDIGRRSPFASGVDHCTWVMLGGMTHDGADPGMEILSGAARRIHHPRHLVHRRHVGTGSKTIVVEAFSCRTTWCCDSPTCAMAKAPGGAVHTGVIFHTPFFYYAPISFVTPMIGAAQGAYEMFREWTKKRKAQDGSSVAEKTSVQTRMARAAADIDAAELLLRRAVRVTDAPADYSPPQLARSVRDFARMSELWVAAIDTLVALSGTAGFATSHPLQRAWRDIHFMSMHISLNIETNFTHYGRMELGLGRDASRPYF